MYPGNQSAGEQAKDRGTECLFALCPPEDSLESCWLPRADKSAYQFSAGAT